MSYLTLVFRDCEEARELMNREDCRAMSHSHALNDRDNLEQELRNIADAKPSEWPEELQSEFRDWAQSRARFALSKARQS